MNRSALNTTVIGSAGAVSFTTGVLRSALVLAGAASASIKKYASLKTTLVVDAVVVGRIKVAGYASGLLTLASSAIGSITKFRSGVLRTPPSLQAQMVGWVKRKHYVKANQSMVLGATLTGHDVYTGEVGRIIVVQAQNRTVVVPPGSSGA